MALYTRAIPGASGKIPYADDYRLVVPWPEETDSVEVLPYGVSMGREGEKDAAVEYSFPWLKPDRE